MESRALCNLIIKVVTTSGFWSCSLMNTRLLVDSGAQRGKDVTPSWLASIDTNAGHAVIQHGKFQPWQNQQNDLWAQSGQNLCCPHEETLGPKLSTECTAKTRMPKLICVFAGHKDYFVASVVLRLNNSRTSVFQWTNPWWSFIFLFFFFFSFLPKTACLS